MHGTPPAELPSIFSMLSVIAHRSAVRLLPLLSFLATAAIAPLHAAQLQIRVATFNASLNRSSPGQLVSNLSTPSNAQAKRIAEIIQRVRPDILLINEFDYDAQKNALRLFHDNYLAISQSGQPALNYPYRYTAPSNTGEHSGKDLDNSGGITTTPGSEAYGNDCFGFGEFPGKYGMAVYSKYPIRESEIRTFRMFLWKDMPGAVLPDRSGTPAPQDWYSPDELEIFRLSSKSHWDLPIEVSPSHVIHLLASHPTPPSFDAAEDRNGRRNHDEIRFWADYIAGARYIYDDNGTFGGLAENRRFVILGDLNADPVDGDSYNGAVNQLLGQPLVNASVIPSSIGAKDASASQGGINVSHKGDPKYDTADFFDGTSGGAGNLRVDHVLPSKTGLAPIAGGVFWPQSSESTYPLVNPTSNSSDHRMVYLDLIVTPIKSEAVRNLEIKKQNSDLVLAWKTQPGVSYKVEESQDLAIWMLASPVTLTLDPETGSATAITSKDLNNTPQNFYRVVSSLDAP